MAAEKVIGLFLVSLWSSEVHEPTSHASFPPVTFPSCEFSVLSRVTRKVYVIFTLSLLFFFPLYLPDLKVELTPILALNELTGVFESLL